MGADSPTHDKLSARTSFFGLKLYVVVGIAVGAFIVFMLVCLSIWLNSKKRRRLQQLAQQKGQKQLLLLPSFEGTITPETSKEIKVDRTTIPVPHRLTLEPSTISDDKNIEKKEALYGSSPVHESTKPSTDPSEEAALGTEENTKHSSTTSSTHGSSRYDSSGSREKASVDIEKRGSYHSLDRGSGASSSRSGAESSIAVSLASSPPRAVPEVSHLGWGHWYTLRDLEVATNSFSDANVLGEGGYGIVYHGILPDDTRIAVKNLLNNRGQAEREFKVEVEAIGRVRHKNLVRLLGYCMEGSQRMLVYEYIDNGNLEQWLHGPLGETQPMSWDVRMKIIIGTAKGLAYLHEGLEPKVVHRDIKSSNILLDSQWNPKVSDFGLAKLLGAGSSHVTTRVMGTFGYVAPEYASTGMLNQKSDVYSYGVLLMELITGREPVDYSRPAGEVNLVEWLKMMVGSRRSDEVADPRMETRPSSRSLKRMLLVALRCVDPDAQKRPEMGHVVHMLEADDNPFREERKSSRVPTRTNSNPLHLQTILRSQGISMDNDTFTTSQRETSSQRALVQDGSRRAMSDDSDIDNVASTADRRARLWRRYES